MSFRWSSAGVLRLPSYVAGVFAIACLLPGATRLQAQQAPSTPAAAPVVPAYMVNYDADDAPDALGSTYIPVDSWVYDAAQRLYSLGYLDGAFLAMRPWTRRSLLHMVQDTEDDIMAEQDPQAVEILASLKEFLAAERPIGRSGRGVVTGVDTVYTRVMGIKGQTLRDSWHLGQTLVNDYGRPYAPGFNNITGFSTVNEWKRFSLHVRGEYQHSPATPGYSLALANGLSCLDSICPFAPPNAPQATIPYGNTGEQNRFRLQEATVSFHLLNHEISGGKSDAWQGPTYGGAMSWSNNAENIYSFRINRVEPLHIPVLSSLVGPVRYDFFVGSLKGHTYPNSPWVHSEMFSFHPTSNVQIAFERTVIWGGKTHVPVNLHTFLRSFFHFSNVDDATKQSSADPGARFSDFSFSWRLPFLRHSVTLYTDSIVHDDSTPPNAPRRAAYRPGLYISHIPGIPRLDFRIEGSSTDTSTLRSQLGSFIYFENQQRQGYTNNGFIMGDWIGREAKGGQAWLTYHLSGNEWIQAEYRTKKNAKDFIERGTSQSDFKLTLVKRLRRDVELNASWQNERWVAPIYQPGTTRVNILAGQITWFPKLKTEPGPRSW